MPLEYLIGFLSRETVCLLIPIVGLARRTTSGDERRVLDLLWRRLLERRRELEDARAKAAA